MRSKTFTTTISRCSILLLLAAALYTGCIKISSNKKPGSATTGTTQSAILDTIISKIKAGNTFYITLDGTQCVTIYGTSTAVCGQKYTGTYAAGQGFTVTGLCSYGYINTATYNNVKIDSCVVSFWGSQVQFDTTYELHTVEGGYFVGHISF